MDILSLIACFEPLVSAVSMRRLAMIVPALLTMTGRAGDARHFSLDNKRRQLSHGSTLFCRQIPVDRTACQVFLHAFMFCPRRVYFGGRRHDHHQKRQIDTRHGAFFSGSLSQVVSGLEGVVLSLVNVARRTAYPLCAKQTVRSEAEKAAIKLRRKKKPKKSKPKPKGRPEGSLKKDKNELNLSPELWRTGELLSGLLKLRRVFLWIKHLALDGPVGHIQAVLMALQNDLHLISKLRKDTALYEKYEGQYGGRGARKEVWKAAE